MRGRLPLLLALGMALAVTPAFAQERATADRPDASDLYQVHVIYAVPSDGRDRKLDTDGSIQRSLATANRWFQEESGRKLRFDTTKDGALDISFLKLARTEAELKGFRAFIRDEIEKDVNAAGFRHARKIYLVYYDGAHVNTCGSSGWPPKNKGNTAVLFLLTEFEKAPPCHSHKFEEATPRFWEFAAVHEILHTLGFVPECAKNRSQHSHVNDDKADILYGESRPPGRRRLDPGNDDYFRHGIPGCLDLENSAFLDPANPGAQPPPEWQVGKTCTYTGYGKRTCE